MQLTLPKLGTRSAPTPESRPRRPCGGEGETPPPLSQRGNANAAGIRSFVHLVKKPHDILIGHSLQRPPKVVMHQLKNSLTFGISQ
jgi:hypothetical protein